MGELTSMFPSCPAALSASSVPPQPGLAAPGATFPIPDWLVKFWGCSKEF